MKRPVLLFSMDSEGFSAPPTTTGALKSYYKKYGLYTEETEIELIHFLKPSEVEDWKAVWINRYLPLFTSAHQQRLNPVLGFSMYTWNAAEFLDLMTFIKNSFAEAFIFAGGPHVQQPEDYLFDENIDLIMLGEGENSFQELLDSRVTHISGATSWTGTASSTAAWSNIRGLAFLDSANQLIKTAPRPRTIDLDQLPSALDVISLCDEEGKPLYKSICYETSRGCPYTCAYCEWGTGAIGGKMYQFSLERIERDWQKIVASGIENIWLADSNFGALKNDLQKAKILINLKNKTGLPKTVATSWSKKHNPRVLEIVLLFHENNLLPHYQLALQTLTPLALKLSNRSNMDANKYEPIAKQMSEAGVPIAAEMIWGLPGDNLRDFEAALDKLLRVFPNINIFGYTLLPGTEFYEKRREYQIESIPVAGYGKAKGEYVIGCHTFSRSEGIEGYFLISAHIILIRGWIMPLTARYLALLGDSRRESQGNADGNIAVYPMLRYVLNQLLHHFQVEYPRLAATNKIDVNKMDVYETRAPFYLALIHHKDKCYKIIKDALSSWLKQHNSDQSLLSSTLQLLQIDEAFCPRTGERQNFTANFNFNATRVLSHLEAMELPQKQDFLPAKDNLRISVPGGVGVFLTDPDGGNWMKGEVIDDNDPDLIPVLELAG